MAAVPTLITQSDVISAANAAALDTALNTFMTNLTAKASYNIISMQTTYDVANSLIIVVVFYAATAS